MSVRDEWVESIGLALARTSPTLLTQAECDEMARAALAAIEPLIYERAARWIDEAVAAGFPKTTLANGVRALAPRALATPEPAGERETGAACRRREG